jgi:hypothetical protein
MLLKKRECFCVLLLQSFAKNMVSVYWYLFPGHKVAGMWLPHRSPSSSIAVNAWNYTSTPPCTFKMWCWGSETLKINIITEIWYTFLTELSSHSGGFANVSGNFTCLAVVFTLRRRLGYHLFHTYIPSALIVVMSWISFWIKPEAIPARVTLGVTSLLTLGGYTHTPAHLTVCASESNNNFVISFIGLWNTGASDKIPTNWGKVSKLIKNVPVVWRLKTYCRVHKNQNPHSAVPQTHFL